MVDASRFIEELSAMVGAAFVQSMTPMEAYHVDGRAPWAVVAPGDIDQVAGVLMLAHREALAVVPWGGGTTMAMGHPPERLDIVLSLQRLSRVLEHEPADLTATVQAGITMADLRRQLGSRGQWWPVEAPLPASATLGGVLATNTSGPKRLLYGTARDLLIGITVVHADGAISKAGGKVAKNVTGYDMMKLYIGSVGTLAVIAEATLKLRPVPSSQQLAWATFVSREAAAEAARRLLAGALLPNAIELVNPPLTAFLRQSVRGPAGDAGWSLLVGIDGAEPAVARQRREINALSQDCGATAWWTGTDDGSLWQALLDRFRPSRAAPMEHVVIRVGTVRTRVGAILDKLTEFSSRLDTPIELSARVGNGLVYASFRLNGDAEQSAHLTQMLTEMRQDLTSERGYMVVESAPPAFKTQVDCWGDVGLQVEVMVGLKRAFDPRRVLNPGRFIDHL
ncbi:MAG TPA: FAD-binding oxidoreductase [Candidatus Tectomicrobia bacterium]